MAIDAARKERFSKAKVSPGVRVNFILVNAFGDVYGLKDDATAVMRRAYELGERRLGDMGDPFHRAMGLGQKAPLMASKPTDPQGAPLGSGVVPGVFFSSLHAH